MKNTCDCGCGFERSTWWSDGVKPLLAAGLFLGVVFTLVYCTWLLT